jgi:hypothetical protein
VGEVINHNDKLSLRACSLICNATVPFCQRYIFSNTCLRNSHSVRRFAELLRSYPEIADRVRTFRLAFGDLQSKNDAVECYQSLLKLNGLHTL